MQNRNRRGTGLAALLVFAVACSDQSALGPGQGDLQMSEALEIAEGQADLLDVVLDGEIDARPSVVSSAESGIAPALSAVPITTEFEFTRTRPCRNGGQIVATGSGTHVVDRETGSVTVDVAGEKSIERCARARGDLVITIDGGGTFAGHRHKENGHYVGLQTNDQEGRFTWETSDGRSGECGYEIHVVWDPATHTKSITGFVCDHEIDRTVTRGRSAGDDGGDDDEDDGNDDDSDG